MITFKVGDKVRLKEEFIDAVLDGPNRLGTMEYWINHEMTEAQIVEQKPVTISEVGACSSTLYLGTDYALYQSYFELVHDVEKNKPYAVGAIITSAEIFSSKVLDGTYLKCRNSTCAYMTTGNTYQKVNGCVKDNQDYEWNIFEAELKFEIVSNKTEEPIDDGADLVGRVFTRGGTCEHTFTDIGIFLEGEPAIRNVYKLKGTDITTIKNVRRHLASGNWKLKGIPTAVQTTPREFAKSLYKMFIDAGWSDYAIEVLHDLTVKPYLKGTSYKVHQIRQLVVSMAAKNKEKAQGILPVKAHKIPRKPDWQSHNPVSGEYNCAEPTEEEYETCLKAKTNGEEIMKETTQAINNITVSLGDEAYKEQTIISVFGQKIENMTEADLYGAIAKLSAQRDSLLALNKTAKSARIAGQVIALASARIKIVAYLDALPDSAKPVATTTK